MLRHSLFLRFLIAAAMLFATLAPPQHHHRTEAYKNQEYRYSKRNHPVLAPERDASHAAVSVAVEPVAEVAAPALAAPRLQPVFTAEPTHVRVVQHLVTSLLISRGPPPRV